MGKYIDTIRVLRSTGMGSSFYGPCELCRKNVSEMFVMQLKMLLMRNDGVMYESPVGGGTYGHRECLIGKFGEPEIERAGGDG